MSEANYNKLCQRYLNVYIETAYILKKVFKLMIHSIILYYFPFTIYNNKYKDYFNKYNREEWLGVGTRYISNFHKNE
jgi:hypothetical protein